MALNLVNSQYIDGLAKNLSKPAINRLNAWKDLIANNKSTQPDLAKLRQINQFFNKLEYKTDKQQFVGKIDYWQTPTEFLISGAGDCEDYAIAKYFSLVAMGIDISKLRIMYVTIIKDKQAHMILTYYPDANGQPLILDNINPRILPASKRQDLKPVYSFNDTGLWLSKLRGEDKRLGSSKRLNKWRNLLHRMNMMRDHKK